VILLVVLFFLFLMAGPFRTVARRQRRGEELLRQRFQLEAVARHRRRDAAHERREDVRADTGEGCEPLPHGRQQLRRHDRRTAVSIGASRGDGFVRSEGTVLGDCCGGSACPP
jgi:hypothetical protein